MATLTPLEIYAIAFGGLFIFVPALSFLLSYIRTPLGRQWVFRNLRAELFRRTSLTPPVTPQDILMQSLYWIGTACYNLVGTESVQDVSQRAAAATAFNIIPLLLGDRLDFVAKIL